MNFVFFDILLMVVFCMAQALILNAGKFAENACLQTPVSGALTAGTV
jgi:hypothetical protein